MFTVMPAQMSYCLLKVLIPNKLTFELKVISNCLFFKGNLCIAKKLNESYDLSSFNVCVDSDGKEHVISGLGSLLNAQIPVKILITYRSLKSFFV